MDEKNNQELSVDELLAKLRSSLMEESSAAEAETPAPKACLLYTSDAADE